jgi:hypothetical protein
MENKDQVYPRIFSRGTLSYYLLVALILTALLLGVFDLRKTAVTKKVIGTYGDYKVIAVKQGDDIWEITLHDKNDGFSGKYMPIDNVQTILWTARQEFKIKKFHLLEEKGRTFAIIITVEE